MSENTLLNPTSKEGRTYSGKNIKNDITLQRDVLPDDDAMIVIEEMFNVSKNSFIIFTR